MTKYCLGFMFNEKETDVLLIEKSKPDWQKGKFNGIGGKVEEGESPVQAMRREFKEECGIEQPIWRYVVSMSMPDAWVVDVFTCKSDNVFNFKTMEQEIVNLISLSELDKFDLLPNLNWLIPMCLDLKLTYQINN